MRVFMVKKLYASYSFGGDAIFVQALACAVTVSFLGGDYIRPCDA
jgi:hypothetical protein